METYSGNSVIIKEVNESLVRSSLRKMIKATKRELSQQTGLSVVTVNSVLQKMLYEKEVLEDMQIPSNGGRPSRVYRYNENSSHVLVIYGFRHEKHDTVNSVIVNLYGKSVFRKEYSFNDVCIDDFDKIVSEAFDQINTIKAIGFGLPGVEADGKVQYNDFDKINGLGFTCFFKDKYHVPVIYENDVNSAAIGYARYHMLADEDCIIAIFLPQYSCPGSGILINRKIHYGKANFGGEIANMPLGFKWHKIDYTNASEYCDCIAKLIAGVCSVIAPTKVIFYAEFLKKDDECNIKKIVDKYLHGLFETDIEFSSDYAADYENGVIASTLELIDNKTVLRKS